MFLRCFLVYTTLVSSTVISSVYFQEQFLDGNAWQERWISSEYKGHKLGAFVLSTGKYYGHPKINQGIQTSQNAMRYGISTRFFPFSTEGKSLVIQYTAKNEQNMKCGGCYIKVFDCSLQPEELSEKTPYLIMFGPDKCAPSTFGLRAILNYKGKYYDIKKRINFKDDTYTHLYTLIINPDNTYMVKLDNAIVASGKLRDDWDVFPPENVPDDSAKKPQDWVYDQYIDDRNDLKHDDWGEMELLPDPNKPKPADWDDDMDGEWQPPLIPNPNFKRRQRRSRNPHYNGPWTRPTIKNPEYVKDPEQLKFEEICAVGFDIWQVESGTVFDNILLTDDVDFAEEQGWKIWGETKDGEIRMAEQQLEVGRRQKGMHAHDEL